jgi:hypothetical protein
VAQDFGVYAEIRVNAQCHGSLMGSVDFRTATYCRQDNGRLVNNDECSRGTHLQIQ